MTRKPGFTFLELLIALSLFAVGMVSIVQIFPLNRRYLAQSSMTTQAAFLAQEEMEKVSKAPYNTFPMDANGAGTYEARPGGAPAPFEREALVQSIDGNYQPATTETHFKRVTVNVYWTEKNVARSYTLQDFVYDH